MNKMSITLITRYCGLILFNEKIFSPLDGEIVKVENSIPDNCTYSGNYLYNTGNIVVIKKDNYFLLLGHLKKNSIKVKECDFIYRCDFIGLVGNSG
jgi:murein DD-endopeptidase MepM/ murein hydrolase activator NlpD